MDDFSDAMIHNCSTTAIKNSNWAGVFLECCIVLHLLFITPTFQQPTNARVHLQASTGNTQQLMVIDKSHCRVRTAK
jgi:hypothetical protein